MKKIDSNLQEIEKSGIRIQGKEIAQRNKLIAELKQRASVTSYSEAFQELIEEVAYTWFNRLIAIRFMEVNDYLPDTYRVLSSEIMGKLSQILLQIFMMPISLKNYLVMNSNKSELGKQIIQQKQWTSCIN